MQKVETGAGLGEYCLPSGVPNFWFMGRTKGVYRSLGRRLGRGSTGVRAEKSLLGDLGIPLRGSPETKGRPRPDCVDCT